MQKITSGDNETSKGTPSPIKWLSYSTLLMNGRDGPGWAFEEGSVSPLLNFLLIRFIGWPWILWSLWATFNSRKILLSFFFIGTSPCSLKCCGTQDTSNGKPLKFRKPLCSFCNYAFNLARKVSNWKRFHSKALHSRYIRKKEADQKFQKVQNVAELLWAPKDSNLKPFAHLY